MMPWKGGLLVAFGLMVGGCFLPAYQVASWTATGVSFVFSGKGMGDHALSLAMNKDCASLRLLEGKDVCVEYEDEHEDSWSAMASTWKMPEPNEDSVAENWAGTADDPAIQPALAQVSNDENSPTMVIAAHNQSAEAETPEKPTVGLDFNGLTVPSWVVSVPSESVWARNSFAPRGLDFDGLVKSSSFDGRVKASSRESDTSLVLTQLRETTAEPVIYLVIGSFRDEENANRLGAKYENLATAVSKSETDGRTIYRLLTGPIKRNLLTQNRARLVKLGIRNSWAVRLCRGNLGVPPCKPVLQEALLR